jgi:hypothetical protein
MATYDWRAADTVAASDSNAPGKHGPISVDDVRAAKADLAESIMQLICQFEAGTSMRVERIDVDPSASIGRRPIVTVEVVL